MSVPRRRVETDGVVGSTRLPPRSRRRSHRAGPKIFPGRVMSIFIDEHRGLHETCRGDPSGDPLPDQHLRTPAARPSECRIPRASYCFATPLVNPMLGSADRRRARASIPYRQLHLAKAAPGPRSRVPATQALPHYSKAKVEPLGSPGRARRRPAGLSATSRPARA
jgi:hypothetical protein